MLNANQLEMLVTVDAPWSVRLEEWQRICRKVHGHADRVAAMIHARARQTCAAAGLDPDLLGIHPHNAMCAYDAGNPWPEVNYSLVRKTQWLIRRSWEPGRIADRIVGRAYDRLLRTVQS